MRRIGTPEKAERGSKPKAQKAVVKRQEYSRRCFGGWDTTRSDPETGHSRRRSESKNTTEKYPETMSFEKTASDLKDQRRLFS